MISVKNFAHRGARSLAPENTMLAIRTAWHIGTQGAEVDIRQTRDGQLVLHHDRELTRTTNVKDIYPDRSGQTLETFSFAELQRLDAGSWFLASDPFGQIHAGALSPGSEEEIRNCRIPLLSELLGYLDKRDWRVNLELKKLPAPGPHASFVEAVIAEIRQQVDPHKIIISSFEHDYLRTASELAPDIEINALIGKNALGRNNWENFGFRTYNANAASITKAEIEAARKKGCTVNLYTVNRLSDMKRFIAWGAETLITDFPQRLKQLQQKS